MRVVGNRLVGRSVARRVSDVDEVNVGPNTAYMKS